MVVEDAEVIDSGTLASGLIGEGSPATVSFDMTFTPQGKMRHIRPISSDPTSPYNWAGQIRNATAVGTFSGQVGGFRFTTGPASSIFAEMGHERNGVFVH